MQVNRLRLQGLNRRCSIATIWLCFVAAVLVFSLVYCTSQVAGGTNLPNQIAGVVSSDSGAAVNVRVSLIRNSADAEKLQVVSSALTDSSGRYCFKNIDSGTYFIEAVNGDSSKIALRRAVSVSDTSQLDLHDTLKATGSLSANVQVLLPANCLAFAWIYNTPYTKPLGPAGDVLFKSLPPGKQKLLILARSRPDALAGIVVARDSAIVKEKSMSVVDTMRLVAPVTSQDTLRIDDFNAGSVRNFLGNGWWTFNDFNDGGNSTVVPYGSLNGFFDEPGAGDTGKCAHVKFVFGTVAHPLHLGFGFRFGQFGAHSESIDLSALKRLELKARGHGSKVSVRLWNDLLNVKVHLELDSLDDQWRTFSFDLDSAATALSSELSWAEVGRFVNELMILNTSDKTGASGELRVDDVEFIY